MKSCSIRAHNISMNLSRGYACTLKSKSGPLKYHLNDSITISNLNASATRINFPVDFTKTSRNKLNLDLYVLADTTEFMRRIHEELRELLPVLKHSLNKRRPNIVAPYFRNHASIDVRAKIGLGVYRDEREKPGNGFEQLLPLSKSTTRLKEALFKMHADRGLDEPEANLFALFQIATNESVVNWKKNSRKLVLLIGKSVGHEPSCIQAYPKLTRGTVSKNLNNKSITLFAASNPPGALDLLTSSFGCGSENKLTDAGQTSHITKATGGVLMNERREVFNVPKILTAFNSKLVRIRKGSVRCGDHRIIYSPQLPVDISPNDHFNITVLANRTALCKAGRTDTNCTIKLRIDGFDSSFTRFRLRMASKNVTGCTKE